MSVSGNRCHLLTAVFISESSPVEPEQTIPFHHSVDAVIEVQDDEVFEDLDPLRRLPFTTAANLPCPRASGPALVPVAKFDRLGDRKQCIGRAIPTRWPANEIHNYNRRNREQQK